MRWGTIVGTGREYLGIFWVMAVVGARLRTGVKCVES